MLIIRIEYYQENQTEHYEEEPFTVDKLMKWIEVMRENPNVQEVSILRVSDNYPMR